MLKLTEGQGSYGEGACWMSAIRYYETLGNQARWSDHPDCVCPIIRALCIRLNDSLTSDEERERVIGPHLFAPIGTAGDNGLTHIRAYYCADRAVRVFAASALDAAGMESEGDKLRGLAEVVDRGTAYAASAAAYAAAYAAAPAAAPAAAHAAHAASAAAHAADAAAGANADILRLILDLCSMSSQPELDSNMIRRTLLEACRETV
jgi:hypothetical protein